MDTDVVIRVENVKKSFKVYYDRNKTLKDILSMPGRGREERREVLKGIDFSVKKGEAVALIGKNGCGKSTMLKLLTKIIYPDTGNITVKGKVSSLIELGAGFHPDMSGRENIYLNASIFGLTRKEIDAKLDEIIKFSELEKFIDNPVRTYSSGMYMRLAFSVAINVQAEVLLIDEILGVGDVSFQKKCFDRLKEIKDCGTTIVIVSHSMSQIEQICDRSIWICDGVIRESGATKTVDAHYYQYMEEERLERIDREEANEKKKRMAKNETTEQEKIDMPAFCGKHAIRQGGQDVFFEDVTFLNQDNEETVIFHTGSTLRMQIKIKSKLVNCVANFSINISDKNGRVYFGTSMTSERGDILQLMGDNEFSFVLSNLDLLSGKYYINIGLYTKQNEILDEIKMAKSFMVHSDYDLKEIGIVHIDHQWDMDKISVISFE